MTGTAQSTTAAEQRNNVATGQEESPVDAAIATWQALEQRGAHLLELVVAELRLAAHSGAWMGILAIVAGGLLLSSWLILLATIGWLAIQAGASVTLTGVALALVNLLVFGVSVWLISRLSRYLSLPHLRSSRRPDEATQVAS